MFGVDGRVLCRLVHISGRRIAARRLQHLHLRAQRPAPAAHSRQAEIGRARALATRTHIPRCRGCSSICTHAQTRACTRARTWCCSSTTWRSVRRSCACRYSISSLLLRSPAASSCAAASCTCSAATSPRDARSDAASSCSCDSSTWRCRHSISISRRSSSRIKVKRQPPAGGSWDMHSACTLALNKHQQQQHHPTPHYLQRGGAFAVACLRALQGVLRSRLVSTHGRQRRSQACCLGCQRRLLAAGRLAVCTRGRGLAQRMHGSRSSGGGVSMQRRSRAALQSLALPAC